MRKTYWVTLNSNPMSPLLYRFSYTDNVTLELKNLLGPNENTANTVVITMTYTQLEALVRCLTNLSPDDVDRIIPNHEREFVS